MDDQAEWDFEHAERRPGVKNARAVVSVAFKRTDFERVSEYAERHNMKTSEFIREAALGAARRRWWHRILFGGS